MKQLKITLFEKKNIVEMLNEEALNILIGIMIECDKNTNSHITGDTDNFDDFTWEYYDHDELNYSFGMLKKKQKIYFMGRIDQVTDIVRNFNIKINKRAHGFLRYMQLNRG